MWRPRRRYRNRRRCSLGCDCRRASEGVERNLDNKSGGRPNLESHDEMGETPTNHRWEKEGFHYKTKIQKGILMVNEVHVTVAVT